MDPGSWFTQSPLAGGLAVDTFRDAGDGGEVRGGDDLPLPFFVEAERQHARHFRTVHFDFVDFSVGGTSEGDDDEETKADASDAGKVAKHRVCADV